MLRKELGDCLSTSGKISQGGTEAWVGICYAEGRMKGRKCQRKGNKQHEQRCCSSCEKAGFLERRDVSRKQQKRSMGYYLFFKFTYFFKNPLSNNFMRGNRPSEQASEVCAIGQHRRESTATQGHPSSIIRVRVVLFLLLQEVKAVFNGPRSWTGFVALFHSPEKLKGKHPLCFYDGLDELKSPELTKHDPLS